MRIALDPVPLVLGVYAYVGELLGRAAARAEDTDAESLGRRHKSRGGTADREVQKLVRGVHTEVKTADKLLKKTGDVWKISRETDLVELVIQPRGEGEDPQAYVLVRPDDVRSLLASIRDAARGAGEDQGLIKELDEAASSVAGKPTDYLTFGFDPWEA